MLEIVENKARKKKGDVKKEKEKGRRAVGGEKRPLLLNCDGPLFGGADRCRRAALTRCARAADSAILSSSKTRETDVAEERRRGPLGDGEEVINTLTELTGKTYGDSDAKENVTSGSRSTKGNQEPESGVRCDGEGTEDERRSPTRCLFRRMHIGGNVILDYRNLVFVCNLPKRSLQWVQRSPSTPSPV